MGTPKFAVVESSPACADTDGGNDTANDIRVGGGGGDVQRMRITGVSADTLSCKTWDGTTLGTTVITVAKPLELRGSFGSQANPDGTTVTFAASDGYGIQRTASQAGLQDQAEYLIPPYFPPGATREILAAQPAGGTGIAGVTWQDLNVAGRAWYQIQ